MSCIFYFEGNNKFASYLVFAVLALDNCCSVAFDCNAGSLAGNQPEFISTQFNNGLKQKKTFFSSGELPEPMVPRVLGETPQVGGRLPCCVFCFCLNIRNRNQLSWAINWWVGWFH